MKKLKQIIAIAGVVFLLLLYTTTFILAVTTNPHSSHLFFASLIATAIVPIIIWAFLMLLKNMEERREYNERVSKNLATKEDIAKEEVTQDNSQNEND